MKLFKYKFLGWVEKYLNISKWEEEEWASICLNENAIDFILENKGKEDWYSLSINPSAISLFENNFDKLTLLDLSVLCSENENLNDFSFDFLCKLFEKGINVFLNPGNDYDEMTYDDYANMIIDELCKKCNNVKVLKKYIPQLKQLGFFYPYALFHIAQNPFALSIIKQYKRYIKVSDFCLNPRASNFVKNINLSDNELLSLSLSFTKSNLEIFQKNIDKMSISCWQNLCKIEDKEVVEFIDHHIDKLDNICWAKLCRNKFAIYMIEKYFDKILSIDNIDIWKYLSNNENAINILERNIENINWEILSGNKNAEKLLRKYPDKIYWNIASLNPSLINLLKENQDKIVLKHFLRNPAIFEAKYEFAKMRDYFELTPLGHGFLPLYLNSENFENWAYSVFDESDIDYHLQEYKENYKSILDPNKNKMIQILNLNKNNINYLLQENNPSKKRRI